MRELSIRARLAIATTVAALGALLLAAGTLLANQRGSDALQAMLDHNMKPLLALQRLDGALNAVRIRAAGVLLDHYPLPGTLNHLRETRRDIEAAWAAVADAPTQDDAEAQLLSRMRSGWARVPALLAGFEKAYEAGDKDAVDDLLQAQWAGVHKDFVKPMHALLPLQEAAASTTLAATLQANRRSAVVALALALATALVVGATMWLTSRSVLAALREGSRHARAIAAGDLTQAARRTRRDEAGELLGALAEMQRSLTRLVGGIRDSADSIRTASGEVAAGNQDLSRRTEQAAARLQHTASSMQQLTGGVHHSADAAAQASRLALSAAEVARRGGAVVAQVVATMDEINASSRRIADIIGVIDGIAFQTNILALNAAVEAARAGEQGRGFAVVAAEVRSLAQRSAEAAKEIKALIGASVERVQDGARLVGDAGSTMDEIVASVQRVTDIVGEISAATGEQRSGIGEVNTAVGQLDQMTQQNAALVEQSTAAAESLSAQARRLADAVAVFKLQPAAA